MISESKRRADDAANGCAMKPKPVGDARALILARLPGTRHELRERTGLSNADAKAAISSLLRAGDHDAGRGVCAGRGRAVIVGV